ncbi:shikimate dehydrogenase [Actinoplanes sp. NPDC049668]|uniref:shikimate dehydrogenase n=1 Tax=unclassified Actinoplanes TaxID=2626549 RepID=UPI0033BAD552
MDGADGHFIVGLIGAGIGTSLSPSLHEREADDQGLRYIYQLIDIAALGLAAGDVGELVRTARQLGFRGLNVTHPCKQEVLGHLDELSPEAAELGAVNTVVFAGGRSIGHNTDRHGFAESFRRGLPGAATGRVVLIGAGGAGAAVAHAMAGLGAGHLTVIDADPDRARRLAGSLRAAGTPADGAGVERVAERLAGADGLINATPVGMEDHLGLPVPAELLRARCWVADVIYRPLETGLLRAARAAGCRTLDGGGMVVHQAAEAFRLFTGRAPEVGRMLRHFAELTAPPALTDGGARA